MPGILSSDILEQQFGPLELTVLKQDASGRVIRNAATKTGTVVELSQVRFRPEGVQQFPEIHQKILGGMSMGMAFQEAGEQPRRHVHASSPYDQGTVPEIFARQFGSQAAPLVTHLTLVAGPNATPYADILEVFRPDIRPWEHSDSDFDQTVADRFEAFGAELTALLASSDDTA